MDNLDWKALFTFYMDHVELQDGTDYLWPGLEDGAGRFKRILDREQFAEFEAFMRERRANKNARR